LFVLPCHQRLGLAVDGGLLRVRPQPLTKAAVKDEVKYKSRLEFLLTPTEDELRFAAD